MAIVPFFRQLGSYLAFTALVCTGAWGLASLVAALPVPSRGPSMPQLDSPKVISTYRNCDIVRAYDPEWQEVFYFLHCGKDRLSQTPLY